MKVEATHLGSITGSSNGLALPSVISPFEVGLSKTAAILAHCPPGVASSPCRLSPKGVQMISISGAPGPDVESSGGGPNFSGGKSLGSSERRKAADSDTYDVRRSIEIIAIS